MQESCILGTPRYGSPRSLWRRVSNSGAHARDPKGLPVLVLLPRLLLPAAFNLRLAPDPASSPPQRQPGSPRPLTSAAGPARPAAALSLRVRELLCPGSGPPSPRAPPPSGSAAGLPWPRQLTTPNRCQPLNRRRHIWLCFALILASRHHLTNKKRRPATTHASPPPLPPSQGLAPSDNPRTSPRRARVPTPRVGQPRVRTGQSPPQPRCVKNQGHLPVPVKIFKKSAPPLKKNARLGWSWLANLNTPPTPSRSLAASLIPESVTIAARGPASGLHRTEFCGSMSAGRAAHEWPERVCPRDTANLQSRQPHREAPSKQVSEASTEAHCWRLPRCASAPLGRANLARGAARGHRRERRAEATGAGCSCWLSARGEAAAGGPDAAPRGSSACPPARDSTAVSRRVQPSSPAARAAAGG